MDATDAPQLGARGPAACTHSGLNEQTGESPHAPLQQRLQSSTRAGSCVNPPPPPIVRAPYLPIICGSRRIPGGARRVQRRKKAHKDVRHGSVRAHRPKTHSPRRRERHLAGGAYLNEARGSGTCCWTSSWTEGGEESAVEEDGQEGAVFPRRKTDVMYGRPMESK
ncbi:hypothetical protein FQA47_006427 [Oryzias melastigma]|uniref:Uncharacterized protein n=1 Tax=Oryzias melastigma TaxID=30732 RepID=A0A834F9Q3_ORYME|nr:hypothetical protein FQA47_006427 [Oryzias melastigma]